MLSNPRNQMNRFVNSISDLVKEECRTAMLHDDMTLSRLIVYDQSIEESKLSRISRKLKRSEQVIKIDLGSRRGLKFKMNLEILRSNLRRVVVLKVVSVLVLLVGRSTMGNV